MHAACSLFLAQVTSKDSFATALNNLMDIDHTTEPWMPWIKHLSGFGNMGLAAFTCTTTSAYTRRWATAPRAKSSRKRCLRVTNLGAGEKPLVPDGKLAAQITK